MKKKGKVLIRVFPQMSLTRKPTEVRMGKGKGSFHSWVAKVSPGCILCEVSTRNIRRAKRILYKVGMKLFFKTRIICRSF